LVAVEHHGQDSCLIFGMLLNLSLVILRRFNKEGHPGSNSKLLRHIYYQLKMMEPLAVPAVTTSLVFLGIKILFVKAISDFRPAD
jgi:hypothetical protein